MKHPSSFLSVLIGLVLAATNCVFADSGRPNIVFFLTDYQPLRAMSHIGPWFSTPNMDQLASEGVAFNNAFVESAVCCVSRASIMMGQYNARHGVRSSDTPLSEEQLDQSFPGLLRGSNRSV